MLAKKISFAYSDGYRKKGKNLKRPLFLLNVMPNRLPYSRYGIVISKKVSTKATGKKPD